MWKVLIKWVESWSYRCEHDWEVIDKTAVYSKPDDKMPYQINYSYRCKKCCEFKKITV